MTCPLKPKSPLESFTITRVSLRRSSSTPAKYGQVSALHYIGCVRWLSPSSRARTARSRFRRSIPQTILNKWVQRKTVKLQQTSSPSTTHAREKICDVDKWCGATLMINVSRSCASRSNALQQQPRPPLPGPRPQARADTPLGYDQSLFAVISRLCPNRIRCCGLWFDVGLYTTAANPG